MSKNIVVIVTYLPLSFLVFYLFYFILFLSHADITISFPYMCFYRNLKSKIKHSDANFFENEDENENGDDDDEFTSKYSNLEKVRIWFFLINYIIHTF